MPIYANTPESRLGRADSKNPATTCRGVTSNGRPCRRPITAEEAGPLSRLKPIRTDNPADENSYCWQHKDQASASAKSSPGPRMSHKPILEERSSIDTLADRLGLIKTQSARPSKGNGRPSVSGQHHQYQPHQSRPNHAKQKETTFCFCFRIPVEDIEPPPRPKPHPLQQTSVSTPARLSGKKPSGQHLVPGSTGHSGRGSRHGSEASQMAQYMHLIRPDCDPQTASLLLAELAKPVSQQDEAGYIYIFWLTPESEPATPPVEAARSLLAPPSTPDNRARRPSDVIDSFARSIIDDDDSSEDDAADEGGSRSRGVKGQAKTRKSKPKKKKTILLKIGRATNVQRRLNEWQRQCGYNISLIRYYPYIPSSSPADTTSRKVPHSHKVERLVHIELQGRGLRVTDRDKCEACGREHREWFEVEASRDAVTEVDEVVRRWSDWNEGLL
ncbi:GIY-YIG nuclease family protein [Dichotomopilus funicola]|uniref:Meiotically up-regulated gene 113-domain-containing protein n=1 Tax=Dichotomopilus funicola TaxID=1934379 RepID=A0AAN6ZTE4_9PEZI|nr:meiotically up-regulated gene 113-domain-containing protein [Dichotomopilus funicola]